MQCEKVDKVFHRPVAIVFSTNDFFAKYLSAMLQSIIDRSSSESTYDIVILTSDLSDLTFKKLLSMVSERDNFSLRRLEVKSIIENYAFFTENVDRLSQETYYRLLIPELFRDYERVIYLDGDMITRVDIAKLYDIPFEGNSLISSRDMNGVMYCHSDYEDGIERAQYRVELMAPYDPDDYVIAGLLVFNIDKVKKYSAEELLTLAASREWLQHDQDVVNYLFAGKTKLLHAKWDFLHEVNRHHIGYMPRELQKEYYEAETDPYIVHYGGNRKPWTSWYVQNDLLFWRALSKTPFFSEVFFGMKWKVEYKAYIVRHLFGKEFESFERDGKLLFSCFGNEIGDYNQTVSIQFCSLNNGLFELEGILPKVGLKRTDDLRVYLRGSQGLFHSVNSNLCAKWYRDEGDLKWEGSAFRFVVPYSKMSTNENFALLYSVNGRYYQSRSFSFGRHAAIGDELRSSYQYAEGKMLSFAGSCFSVEDVTELDAKKREEDLLEDLSYWKCYEEVKVLRSEIAPCDKPIWLFADSVGTGRGSARALFEYVCEHQDEVGDILPVLVVDPDCRNGVRGSGKERIGGGVLVERGSIEHKRLFLGCALCFTSSMFHGDFDPLHDNYSPYRDMIFKLRMVYVPHAGVFTDVSGWLNRSEFNPWILATLSAEEVRDILDNPKYSLDESTVKNTGIPRYDNIRENQEKTIVILPAKRRYLMRDISKPEEEPCWVVKQNFVSSDYFVFYNSLINDKRLLGKLKNAGYSICFIFHREMLDSVKYFDFDPEVVRFCGFEEYGDIFPSSKLFITDYSPVASDAAMLKRPVLYARFPELEAAFEEYPFGHPVIDPAEEGLGPVSFSKDDMVSSVVTCIDHGCSLDENYSARLDQLYPSDCFESSCARILRVVESRGRSNGFAKASMLAPVDDEDSIPLPVRMQDSILAPYDREKKLRRACRVIGLPERFNPKRKWVKEDFCWGTEIGTALPIKKGPNVSSKSQSRLRQPVFIDCKTNDWELMFLAFLSYKAFGSIACDSAAWNESTPRWCFGSGWRVVAEKTKFDDYQVGDVVSFRGGKNAIVYGVSEGFAMFVRARVSSGVCRVRIGGLSEGLFGSRVTRISRLPQVNWVVRKIYA